MEASGTNEPTGEAPATSDEAPATPAETEASAPAETSAPASTETAATADSGRIRKTPDERKSALDSALQLWGAKGWRTENRSDFQATVSKGKDIHHVLHIILCILTAGLWLIVYLPMWLLTGIKRRMLTVDEFGNVIEQKI